MLICLLRFILSLLSLGFSHQKKESRPSLQMGQTAVNWPKCINQSPSFIHVSWQKTLRKQKAWTWEEPVRKQSSDEKSCWYGMVELEARQLTFSRKENGIRPFSRSQNRLKTRWSAVILLFNGAKGVHIVLVSVLCCTFQNVDKLEHLCSELKLEKLFKTLEKRYLSNKYFLCSVCFYFRSYKSTKHKTSCDSENCSISALSFVCDGVLLCSSGWPQTRGSPPPLPPES